MTAEVGGSRASKRRKLTGRAFYESIGSPKLILAPMVDQSEFAWRMLTRSFLPRDSSTTLLAYSPMFHARLFASAPKYRDSHFQPLKGGRPSKPQGEAELSKGSAEKAQTRKEGEREGEGEEKTEGDSPGEPYLDGHPALDRPLIVQFCANQPDEFLAAAQLAAPFCDAVDLNLGCPQGIARKGHYGAFLQEDWPCISSMISRLRDALPVPVTAKFRVLETPQRTLEYARMILDAGASILTVHGRRREQKGHNTGLADWAHIRHLRDNLPADTVIFANGNVLQHGDIAACLAATGADGVMSAEGNLHDPSIFAPAPARVGPGPRGMSGEYWVGRDGRGGWRVDAVMRRYLDIIHRHVLGEEPPARTPLFIPGVVGAAEQEHGEQQNQPAAPHSTPNGTAKPPREPQETKPTVTGTGPVREDDAQPPPKRQKTTHGSNPPTKSPKSAKSTPSPNISALQPHLFRLLRALVSRHHPVRDALARSPRSPLPGAGAHEEVLRMVEEAVAAGIAEYEDGRGEVVAWEAEAEKDGDGDAGGPGDWESSVRAVRRCRRAWWVCQPHVRPLPREALEKGSLTVGKKEKRRLESGGKREEGDDGGAGGTVRVREGAADGEKGEAVEVPREGLVCG